MTGELLGESVYGELHLIGDEVLKYWDWRGRRRDSLTATEIFGVVINALRPFTETPGTVLRTWWDCAEGINRWVKTGGSSPVSCQVGATMSSAT